MNTQESELKRIYIDESTQIIKIFMQFKCDEDLIKEILRNNWTGSKEDESQKQLLNENIHLLYIYEPVCCLLKEIKPQTPSYNSFFR